MTENHYVDPKDQHIAAEGVPAHSELTTMYRDAQKVELGHWMHEDERQAAMEKDRHDIILGLRKPALSLGLAMSVPVILGILLAQLSMSRNELSQTDAMALQFLLLFLLASLVWLTYALLKRIGETFRKHTVRASPVVLTTIASLIFLIRPTLRLADNAIGGIAGYYSGLGVLLITGTLLGVTAIFVWTAVKIPALVKVLALVAFFCGAVTTAYLV